MFSKILIANRGEIALRILRSCHELGIKTVAIYSEADRESLHVRFANEAICIGPAQSINSYLNIPAIMSAAEITNAEAIHPGYGFLAENARFANICTEHKLKFIGPESKSIGLMGNKIEAKQVMKTHNIPTIPGSDGAISDAKEAQKVCQKIGYPVILKAAAGGGGRGMRIVKNETELAKALMMCQAEAEAAFSSKEVYIERYFSSPRHIEVQILGDQYGNVIHLGERDCTLQRRHQKLIEETPSPYLNEQQRQNICNAAVKIAEVIKYENAGTIEFLVDENKNFYFMEMNTRIQVEHPITEEVSHQDLIAHQIAIANGHKLPSQSKFKNRGHAIECRINAEDPKHNFRPSAGVISAYHTPGGHSVRIDSHIYTNYKVPPYYDSMIAKLIVSAPNRGLAINRMQRALNELIIEGISTNIDFQLALLQDKNFVNGNYSTNYIENTFKQKL